MILCKYVTKLAKGYGRWRGHSIYKHRLQAEPAASFDLERAL